MASQDHAGDVSLAGSAIERREPRGIVICCESLPDNWVRRRFFDVDEAQWEACTPGVMPKDLGIEGPR